MQVRRNAAVSGRGRAAYACGGGCHGALSKPPLIMVRLSYRALVASCCTVPTVPHRPCGVGAALLCGCTLPEQTTGWLRHRSALDVDRIAIGLSPLLQRPPAPG